MKKVRGCFRPVACAKSLRRRSSRIHRASLTLVQTVAGKLRVGTMGDVGRLPGQPAGPAPDQLPAALNGFDRPLRYAALQAHASWVVPFPRRSALTRCCVCTVRRMRWQSTSKCRGRPARPAVAGAGWRVAIGSSSPARWAVRWAVRSSHACTNASPLTLHVDTQKFRYRRPWPSTPPPGPIRPRQCPPPLSLMAGHVGRPAGAFRRLRLPADDSPHAGGALPVRTLRSFPRAIGALSSPIPSHCSA